MGLSMCHYHLDISMIIWAGNAIKSFVCPLIQMHANGDDSVFTDTPNTPPSSASRTTPTGQPRKQLPSIPDAEMQQSEHRVSSPRGNHTYGMYFLEYSLMAE